MLSEYQTEAEEREYPRMMTGGGRSWSLCRTLKHVGEWGPVEGAEWTQKEAAVVCELWFCCLCGRQKGFLCCVQSGSALQDSVEM